MTKSIALLLVGLALTGAGTLEAATILPWSTVSDLEDHLAEAYRVAGCDDPRPIEVYVLKDRLDTYLLVVTADVRWAIIGPSDSQGETPIWYGTVSEGDRLVIERSRVGTPETNVCPFLLRWSA